MEIVIIILLSIIFFSLAYRFYSPIISKKLGVEPNRPTPAHTQEDGVDYCPAKAPVLFGHHFASIAGAAPIVGPVIAAAYGWGPVMLWIILGGIFLGAVHDFAALVASIHNGGRSMGDVIGRYIGRSGRLIFLFFLWATLVLLVAVFMDVVAKTFVAEPPAGTASVFFIGLAVFFGLAIYKLRMPLFVSSFVGILLLTICIVAGWYFPMVLSFNIWRLILIAYIFTASVTPVWILLQPRDYLNSFLLYGLLIAAVLGVFVAHPATAYPVFVSWKDPELGSLFPILFVTVACGAISGYHSVVAGGTTAKQLDKEREARPIGYGGMLVESLLAVLAVMTVMHLSSSEYAKLIKEAGPVAIFSGGVGAFLNAMGLNAQYGTTFAALAVSAFVLTTLDTATRLARFAFQEFFQKDGAEKQPYLARSRFVATLVTVSVAGGLAFSGQWKAIWPIFGSANQLLAALALLAVSLWLTNRGMKSGFLRIPMVIMFLITVSALVTIIFKDISAGNYVLAIISSALLIMTGILIVKSVKAIKVSAKK